MLKSTRLTPQAEQKCFTISRSSKHSSVSTPTSGLLLPIKTPANEHTSLCLVTNVRKLCINSAINVKILAYPLSERSSGSLL